MKRIRFIVTGLLERAAFVPSFSRLFPAEDVDGSPVEWLRPRRVHGATTHRLRSGDPPSQPMRTLARAAIAEAIEGADGTPSDLVLVVDDLELHNLDQPEVVCAHFQRAFDLEVEARQASRAAEVRLRDALRARCAFHLVTPMIESYLFGEHAALVRAGCASAVAPALVDADVERFESSDEGWRSAWEAENARKSAAMPWWRAQCHAKHYLEHLVAQNEGGYYDEVVGGVAGFAALDWQGVPAHRAAVPLVRALFEDIADFFGVPNPLGAGAPSPLTYPEKHVDRRRLRLRNL